MTGEGGPHPVVLPDGTALIQPGGGEVSSDTCILGGAVSAPSGSVVFDLGSGSGGAGLVAARANPGCTWVGIDVRSELLELALLSAGMNDVTPYLAVCGDVTRVPFLMRGGMADVVITNPPYLRRGESRPSPDPRRRSSRIGGRLSMASFVRAAAHLLRAGGRFLVVHRPANLVRLALCCRSFGLNPEELRTYGGEDGPAELILLGCRKGSSRKLRIMPRRNLPSPGAG
ncbi:methyltransferase [Candidatus Fermentibacteria bacterium]|nr:methyltransferase [Candidatus Fermentibacteria bacterium]